MWNPPANLAKKTILVVDDNPTNLRFLQEILKEDYKVHASASGRLALSFLERKTPDLILLDIGIPDIDGYEIIRRLKNDAIWAEIPVIFLTAQEGRDKEQEAFRLGAVDYILKPISAGVVQARVKLHLELESYKRNLERIVEVRTTQLRQTQETILDMLSGLTAFRDNETGAHLMRTTRYVELLTKRLRECRHPKYLITTEYAENIARSSKLHDIGKVAVPDSILLKPSALTPAEFEVIKKHTQVGYQILNDAIDNMGNPPAFLHTAREIIISHHEWWNGNGYPYGLRGEDIPLPGRLMAIADVYDALVSNRPYKRPLSHDNAVHIIKQRAGIHFDPLILEMCGDVFHKFPNIVREYKDEYYPMHMLKA